MSDDLPRFELYQKLHADPLLQTSLLQIFTDVVEFSVKAFQYFSRSTPGRPRLFGPPQGALLTQLQFSPAVQAAHMPLQG
jgi:hypothetical protein